MRELLSTLSDIVGPEGVLSGKALEGRAAGIWSKEPFQAMAIIRPKSTEEVAAVLKVCHAVKQSGVPVGGMTGLAGAHKTGASDIALSLERMAAIESIDRRSRKMTVQAGTILQKIQEHAQQANLMFPLDLGARGRRIQDMAQVRRQPVGNVDHGTGHAGQAGAQADARPRQPIAADQFVGMFAGQLGQVAAQGLPRPVDLLLDVALGGGNNTLAFHFRFGLRLVDDLRSAPFRAAYASSPVSDRPFASRPHPRATWRTGSTGLGSS